MFNELKDKITLLSTQVDQEVDSVNELEVKSNSTSKFTFKALEIDNALKSKKESIVRCKLKANQVEKTISTMKDIQDLISKEQKDELEKNSSIYVTNLKNSKEAIMRHIKI
ncbi:hypothetical protein NIES2111_19880 [Nostoc sp. NIES-2111]|nr:hypothetical protein NIES2111_19880 [Nostoc sp. NIES-2111]